MPRFPHPETPNISTSPNDSTESIQDSDWSVESLFHFVVNTWNFERSLEFYQRLGFGVLRDNRDVIWPQFVGENFGMEAAQGRGALLGLGESEHHTRLDLIEWLEPRWENPNDPPSPKRVPRIMALRTRNLRAAYEDLQNQGVAFITPPRNADPKAGVESVVCCHDPEGSVVELIEYMGIASAAGSMTSMSGRTTRNETGRHTAGVRRRTRVVALATKGSATRFSRPRISRPPSQRGPSQSLRMLRVPAARSVMLALRARLSAATPARDEPGRSARDKEI